MLLIIIRICLSLNYLYHSFNTKTKNKKDFTSFVHSNELKHRMHNPFFALPPSLGPRWYGPLLHSLGGTDRSILITLLTDALKSFISCHSGSRQMDENKSVFPRSCSRCTYWCVCLVPVFFFCRWMSNRSPVCSHLNQFPIGVQRFQFEKCLNRMALHNAAGTQKKLIEQSGWIGFFLPLLKHMWVCSHFLLFHVCLIRIGWGGWRSSTS